MPVGGMNGETFLPLLHANLFLSGYVLCSLSTLCLVIEGQKAMVAFKNIPNNAKDTVQKDGLSDGLSFIVKKK